MTGNGEMWGDGIGKCRRLPGGALVEFQYKVSKQYLLNGSSKDQQQPYRYFECLSCGAYE